MIGQTLRKMAMMGGLKKKLQKGVSKMKMHTGLRAPTDAEYYSIKKKKGAAAARALDARHSRYKNFRQKGGLFG